MTIEQNSPGEIAIPCVCGITYSAPRSPFVKCPGCGHVWNIRPEINPMAMEGQIKLGKIIKSGKIVTGNGFTG